MATEVKEENNSKPSDMKSDGDSGDEKIESKTVDNSIKEDKDSVKNESKEESEKEESDDDDDDDEEEKLALLDRPVEVTGCRARKKVERLEVSFSTPKEKQEFREGKGKKLGDCPRIEAQIQKLKVVDLKPLHKILFNRTGSANEIKKNIRKFSGFPFEKDSSEFSRRKTSVEKLTTSILKKACKILDIEGSGKKEDIVNGIMTFLLNPEDSGKKVPKSKKKVAKDKKKASDKKVKTEKKSKTNKNDSDESGIDDDDDDDDSTGGEASMGGTDEENEDASLSDEPKKKSKETKTAKNKSKVEKGKKDDKKGKSSKRKAVDEDSPDSSGEEQPAKKAKMPSDEEISKLVKDILESADLQEITMKKVIKQVSDAFPDFDLSHKKGFIKSTIKSVISSSYDS